MSDDDAEARKQARIQGYGPDTADAAGFAAGWNASRAEVAELRQALTEAKASHQAEIGRLTADRDRLRDHRANDAVIQQLYKERDAALASLAEERELRAAAIRNWTHVQDEYERVLPVVEAARLWRQLGRTRRHDDPEVIAAHNGVLHAVDALNTGEDTP